MWLTFAILGYSLLAIVAILDKFIVSSERVRPIVYVFYSTAPAAGLLVFCPFIERFSVLWLWLVPLVAGISFTAGLYAMYAAFSKSEVSHAGPFIGAAIAFFTAFFSHYVLGESFTTRQLFAIGVLVIGSHFIARQTGRRGFYPGLQYALVAGAAFAAFFVTAKYVYVQVGFASGFVWLWGAIGLVGLSFIFSPALRRHLREKPARPKGHRLAVIAVDKILAFGAVVSIQYAVSTGSVAMVNALTGFQYALLALFVALLSRFFPKMFKENYAPGEAKQEGLAILIIGLGLYLLLT